MDSEHSQWIKTMLVELKAAFGGRLLYAALAGSHARGEAGPKSDIDVNIVLDRVDFEDIKTCREMVKKHSRAVKPCGFICGREELMSWPPHELFHFMQGSVVLHGSLRGIVKEPSRSDIEYYIKNAASASLHAVRHTYIYGGEAAEAVESLKTLYKNVFFLLQARVYIAEGRYIGTLKELYSRTSGADREVLGILLRWDLLSEDREYRPEHYFQVLERWCARALVERGA